IRCFAKNAASIDKGRVADGGAARGLEGKVDSWLSGANRHRLRPPAPSSTRCEVVWRGAALTLADFLSRSWPCDNADVLRRRSGRIEVGPGPQWSGSSQRLLRLSDGHVVSE